MTGEIYQPEAEELWEHSRVYPLNRRWVGMEYAEDALVNLQERIVKMGEDLLGEIILTFEIDIGGFLDQGCQHGEGNECDPDDPDCEVCCLAAHYKNWNNIGKPQEV